MGETFEFFHGKDTAAIYDSIAAELKEVDEKYKDLKDKFGNPIKASSLYIYSFEPTKLNWRDGMTNEIKEDVIAVFDKYLPRSPK